MVSLVPVADPSAITPRSTKSLLRHASVAGTIRKSEDAFGDSELSKPASPSKKQKVTFNPEVEEKVMETFRVQGRGLDFIRVEVKRAIEAHARGDSDAYDAIKEMFESEAEEDDEREGEGRGEELRAYLLALTSHTSLLSRNCSSLVKQVLDYEWLGQEENFVKVYVHFLGSLASAQGAYIGMILGTLVGHFQGVRFSSGRLFNCPDVSREQLLNRVHMALKYLLHLIPSASSILSPILTVKFPFSDDSKKRHVTYIENLLRLCEYAKELKFDVLSLITDRLVKIDVQMQTDLDDMDDEVSAAIVQDISLGPSARGEAHEEDSDADTDSVSSDEDLDEESARLKEIQGNVEKMDVILDLLFKIYDPYFSDPLSIEASTMFETLLGHFATTILPAYRSRHTQFLLFHFAQKAEHLIDLFAGTCVTLAFNASQPAVLRQSSAAYLASFVARGARVPPQVVRTVFEYIGSQIDIIEAQNERTCRGPDLKRYGTYYAMTQALLYIFCFRWRDLLEIPDILEADDPIAFVNQELTWAPGVKETLSRTIYSKLNPLKICSPPIVNEFAKIAHHLRFLYVYPLLETNKRIKLSQFQSSMGNGALRDTGNGGNEDSWHQLDAYFPFDPYRLPISKRWVEDDYIQWRGVPGLDQELDSDADSEEEEEDDEDDFDGELDTQTTDDDE